MTQSATPQLLNLSTLTAPLCDDYISAIQRHAQKMRGAVKTRSNPFPHPSILPLSPLSQMQTRARQLPLLTLHFPAATRASLPITPSDKQTQTGNKYKQAVTGQCPPHRDPSTAEKEHSHGFRH